MSHESGARVRPKWRMYLATGVISLGLAAAILAVGQRQSSRRMTLAVRSAAATRAVPFPAGPFAPGRSAVLLRPADMQLAVLVKEGGELCLTLERPSTQDAGALCGQPSLVQDLYFGALTPPEDQSRRILYGAVPVEYGRIRLLVEDAAGTQAWTDVPSATTEVAPGVRVFAAPLGQGMTPLTLEAGRPGEDPAITRTVPNPPAE